MRGLVSGPPVETLFHAGPPGGRAWSTISTIRATGPQGQLCKGTRRRAGEILGRAGGRLSSGQQGPIGRPGQMVLDERDERYESDEEKESERVAGEGSDGKLDDEGGSGLGSQSVHDSVFDMSAGPVQAKSALGHSRRAEPSSVGWEQATLMHEDRHGRGRDELTLCEAHRRWGAGQPWTSRLRAGPEVHRPGTPARCPVHTSSRRTGRQTGYMVQRAPYLTMDIWS